MKKSNNQSNTSVRENPVYSDSGVRPNIHKVNPKLGTGVEVIFEDVKSEIVTYNKNDRKCFIISLVIVLPFVILLAVIIHDVLLPAALGLFSTFMLYAIITVIIRLTSNKGRAYYKDKYANLCIAPLVRQIEPNAEVMYGFEYYPLFGYAEEDVIVGFKNYLEIGRWLYNFGVIPYFNNRSNVSLSINTLKANREGFFFINMEATSEYKSDDHIRTVTIFKGPIIAVRLKHKISGRFSCHTTRKGIVNKERDGSYKRFGDAIDVESQRFNELFNAYASEQSEAFYILTPAVIEKLLKLQKSYNKFGLYISQDYCIFGINTGKEYFKIPSSVKEAEEMSIEKYWKELELFMDFIYEVKDSIDLSFE